jgi:hypothetical protein
VRFLITSRVIYIDSFYTELWLKGPGLFSAFGSQLRSDPFGVLHHYPRVMQMSRYRRTQIV